jgi:hypothetical protein
MEVNEINVLEMSPFEQKEINGGSILAFIAIMGAVVYVYEVVAPSVIKGFKEGFKSTQYQSEIPND